MPEDAGERYIWEYRYALLPEILLVGLNKSNADLSSLLITVYKGINNFKIKNVYMNEIDKIHINQTIAAFWVNYAATFNLSADTIENQKIILIETAFNDIQNIDLNKFMSVSRPLIASTPLSYRYFVLKNILALQHNQKPTLCNKLYLQQIEQLVSKIEEISPLYLTSPKYRLKKLQIQDMYTHFSNELKPDASKLLKQCNYPKPKEGA